ncbi:FecR domain-containing protein [uncultured Sphaerotilus sp.]|uniref:FecR domain-containing protein n=1 Tax=uncultured Sphaerotilus sp. TaxID=474984 RepID=UPI0030CA353C
MTVTGRDTLIALGRRFLADPRQWPQLQSFNQIADPRRLPVGTVLRIPLRLMVTEPVPATVVAVSGDVRGADGRSIAEGQTVPQGGSLRTGDGQATIRLVDGTVLKLRPSTALQVDVSRRLPRVGGVLSGVQVQEGQVEVKAQKAANTGLPGFRVSTPQGLLGVRGTEFRVAVDGRAEVTRSEVLEGQVAADGLRGGPGQRVNAGFGVVVDRTGDVQPPVRLLAAPDLSALPALQERLLVRMPLAPQPGAVAYLGQIAADARFEPVLQTVRTAVGTAGTSLRFADLPDGRYVVRVRAEDAQGLQGLDAQHTFTLKARPEPPLPTNPAPGAILSAVPLEFAWTASQEAGGYRWQLARTEDFRELLHDRRGLVPTSIRITDLPPGVYHWRLASERSATDQGPFGAVQRLELRALPAPLAPPVVGTGGIRLSWEGLPGQTFEVEFARDASFAAVELARRTEAPALEVMLPGTGRYFVRLRARDPDGYLGPYTAPQQFSIPNCLRDGQGRCAMSNAGQSVLIGP